jgi:hypothetical protein
MTENNRLDHTFGPVGTAAGTVLFVAGVILTFFHLTGLILILIGAFVGFSSTSALIDYEKKRVKFSNNLFGIIRIGKWLGIEPAMKLGLKESNLTWRSYSRGNRSLDIVNTDYRIILIDPENKEIMEMKKRNSKESAMTELETMSKSLGLTFFV